MRLFPIAKSKFHDGARGMSGGVLVKLIKEGALACGSKSIKEKNEGPFR